MMGTSGLGGTAGDLDGEKEATFAWLGMPRLSVVLTPVQWMVQPVREVLEMMNSMYVASVGSCLTVPSPWVLTTSSSIECSLPSMNSCNSSPSLHFSLSSPSFSFSPFRYFSSSSHYI